MLQINCGFDCNVFISEGATDVEPSPEKIVGWILQHQDDLISDTDSPTSSIEGVLSATDSASEEPDGAWGGSSQQSSVKVKTNKFGGEFCNLLIVSATGEA